MARKRARSLDSEQRSEWQHQLARSDFSTRLDALETLEKEEFARHAGILALFQELRSPGSPTCKRVKVAEDLPTPTTAEKASAASTTSALLQTSLSNVSTSVLSGDRRYQLLTSDALMSSTDNSIKGTVYDIVIQVLNCLLAETTTTEKGRKGWKKAIAKIGFDYILRKK